MLLAALGSSALTLGRPRGAVIIGQPLNVTIPVRVDAGDDTSAQCYEADVFHADTRIDGGRVSVTVEPGATAQDMIVRVRSAAVVDEPILSIYLRAGCVQRSTRRYVLLADIATEIAPQLNLPSVTRQSSAAPDIAGATPLAPLAPPAGARPPANGRLPSSPSPASATQPARPGSAASASTGIGTAPTNAAAERVRQQRADAQAAGQAGSSSGSPVPAASATPRATAAAPARESVVRRKPDAPAPRSRLKLDPLDLLIEVDPVLKSSNELLTPPSENAQVRAEAAALWRAINAQPLDILRDTERLKSLEADVKSLRDVTAKNQASLTELQAELQKAQSQRYANVLVYSLAGLLLAALALAGFLWYRAREAARGRDAWWQGGEDPREARAADSGPRDPAMAPKPVMEVDVDLGMDENLFASLKSRTVTGGTASTQRLPVPVPPPARPAVLPRSHEHSDFGHSLPGLSRAVNAEELFDIQQQADFFVSLGQHEQAIEVLKNHISDNVETSALAYLDLLKIYHTLERRADYDLLREDFNRVFNAQVPLFDSYTAESNGLEAYQTAMSRIEALWPSAKVLEVIEESIFRKPGTGDGEAFDLEAYRELLLLYAIAKDVVDRREDSMDFEASGPPSMPPEAGDSGPRRGRFSATSIQPLSATNYSETGSADLLPEIPMPKPSPRLGLDIDLDDPGPDLPMFGGHEKTNFDLADFHSESLLEDVDSRGHSGPQEPESRSASDSHLIDFDLFDDATEAEIAPKPVKPLKPGKR